MEELITITKTEKVTIKHKFIENRNVNSLVHNEQEEERSDKSDPKISIILLNDDTTPMNYVVLVLTEIFNYSESKSNELMLEAHTTGSAVIGTFPEEKGYFFLIKLELLNFAKGYDLKYIIKEL